MFPGRGTPRAVGCLIGSGRLLVRRRQLRRYGPWRAPSFTGALTPLGRLEFEWSSSAGLRSLTCRSAARATWRRSTSPAAACWTRVPCRRHPATRPGVPERLVRCGAGAVPRGDGQLRRRWELEPSAARERRPPGVGLGRAPLSATADGTVRRRRNGAVRRTCQPRNALRRRMARGRRTVPGLSRRCSAPVVDAPVSLRRARTRPLVDAVLHGVADAPGTALVAANEPWCECVSTTESCWRRASEFTRHESLPRRAARGRQRLRVREEGGGTAVYRLRSFALEPVLAFEDARVVSSSGMARSWSRAVQRAATSARRGRVLHRTRAGKCGRSAGRTRSGPTRRSVVGRPHRRESFLRAWRAGSLTVLAARGSAERACRCHCRAARAPRQPCCKKGCG